MQEARKPSLRVLKNKIQSKIKSHLQGKNTACVILPNSGNMWRGLDRKVEVIILGKFDYEKCSEKRGH